MLKPYNVIDGTIIALNASFVLYDVANVNPSGDPGMKVYIDENYVGIINPGESFEIPFAIRQLRFDTIDPALQAVVRAGVVKVVSRETTITGAVVVSGTVAVSNTLNVNPTIYDKTLAALSGKSCGATRTYSQTPALFSEHFFFLPVGSTVKALVSGIQFIGDLSTVSIDVEKFTFVTDPVGSNFLARFGVPSGLAAVKEYRVINSGSSVIATNFPTAVTAATLLSSDEGPGLIDLVSGESAIAFTGGEGIRIKTSTSFASAVAFRSNCKFFEF